MLCANPHWISVPVDEWLASGKTPQQAEQGFCDKCHKREGCAQRPDTKETTMPGGSESIDVGEAFQLKDGKPMIDGKEVDLREKLRPQLAADIAENEDEDDESASRGE